MSEWQPIETAPLEESVLIYIPNSLAEHYGPAIYRGLQVERGLVNRRRIWKVTGLHFGSDATDYYTPSHWMPLPAPPSSEPPARELLVELDEGDKQ